MPTDLQVDVEEFEPSVLFAPAGQESASSFLNIFPAAAKHRQNCTELLWRLLHQQKEHEELQRAFAEVVIASQAERQQLRDLLTICVILLVCVIVVAWFYGRGAMMGFALITLSALTLLLLFRSHLQRLRQRLTSVSKPSD